MANIGGRILEDTAVAVAGDFVPTLKALPIPAIDDPDPTLAAQIKDIVEHLAQNRIGDLPITAPLKAELNGELEKDEFKSLAFFGPVLDVRLIERKSEGSGWATSYKVTTETLNCSSTARAIAMEGYVNSECTIECYLLGELWPGMAPSCGRSHKLAEISKRKHGLAEMTLRQAGEVP